MWREHPSSSAKDFRARKSIRTNSIIYTCEFIECLGTKKKGAVSRRRHSDRHESINAKNVNLQARLYRAHEAKNEIRFFCEGLRRGEVYSYKYRYGIGARIRKVRRKQKPPLSFAEDFKARRNIRAKSVIYMCKFIGCS